MKKKFQIVFILLLIISIFTTPLTAVFAATSEYGFPFGYIARLRGDLSFSGLSGIQERKAKAIWHDTRFHNVISGKISPYYVTQSYEIQEELETDDFKYRSGYHLIPLDEQIIKRFAALANGNANFVWNAVQSTPIYFYDEMPYVRFGYVVHYSGGGDPESIYYPGQGITSPSFKTTYKTTNWPIIHELEAREGGKATTIASPSSVLYVRADTHSVYNLTLLARITINDDSNTSFLIRQKTGTGYKLTLDEGIPFSEFKHLLKKGKNKITITVSDKYERTHEKSIIIDFISDEQSPEPQPTEPQPTEPQPPEPPASQGEDGRVEGRVFWELRRFDANKPSGVYVESNFRITSSHYAIRNISHTVQIGSQTLNAQSEGKLSKLIESAKNLKGSSVSYNFRYEYTNYPIGTVCSGSGEEEVCWWDSSPDWSRGQTLIISDSIPIDHRQEETITTNTIENAFSQRFSVGKEDIWNYPSKQRNDYFEEWKKSSNNQNQSHYQLKTQTTLPITPGQLTYEVKLPSGEHEKGSFHPLRKGWSSGYYFPADVDDSLKQEYKNHTKYTGYAYAFPLQQSKMQDQGTNSGKRMFEWEYVTDMFFESAATGFIVGIPYASPMKNYVANGISLPSYQSFMETGKKKIEEEFMKAVGQKFVDDVLYTTSQNDFHKLQKYKIPVTADSPLKPNTTYKNHIVLENMGLNDMTFRFDQSFLFKHYLFGSAKDDAWIVAQREGRVPLDHLTSNDVHTFILKNEHKKPIAKLNKESLKNIRMHKFRRADRDFIEKVKQIVGEEFDNVNKNIIRAEPR